EAGSAAPLHGAVCALEPEREHRAGGDRAPGMRFELRRDGLGSDDRVAPVVEVDPFREELGAETVPVTGDRVDADPLHRLPRGIGRTRAPSLVHRRWMQCASNSVANTSSALATKRTAPSG